MRSSRSLARAEILFCGEAYHLAGQGASGEDSVARGAAGHESRQDQESVAGTVGLPYSALPDRMGHARQRGPAQGTGGG